MMKKVGIFASLSVVAFALGARDFDVRDFGAKGDGRTKKLRGDRPCEVPVGSGVRLHVDDITPIGTTLLGVILI